MLFYSYGSTGLEQQLQTSQSKSCWTDTDSSKLLEKKTATVAILPSVAVFRFKLLADSTGKFEKGQ